MKLKHRALTLLLSVAMLLTFMPAMAFADDEAAPEEPAVTVAEESAEETAEETVTTAEAAEEVTVQAEPEIVSAVLTPAKPYELKEYCEDPEDGYIVDSFEDASGKDTYLDTFWFRYFLPDPSQGDKLTVTVKDDEGERTITCTYGRGNAGYNDWINPDGTESEVWIGGPYLKDDQTKDKHFNVGDTPDVAANVHWTTHSISKRLVVAKATIVKDPEVGVKDGIVYRLNTNKRTVSAVDTTKLLTGNVVIPEKVKLNNGSTHKVTAVSLMEPWEECAGFKTMSSVTIPSTVSKLRVGYYRNKDYDRVQIPGFVVKTKMDSAAIRSAVDDDLTVQLTDLKAKLKKATGGKKLVKATINKNADANGYQVQVVNKKTGSVKTSTLKVTKKNSKKKILTKTVKKLKKGKYTVKVRAYKNYDGVKCYGKFSKGKTVKVK